MINMLVFLILNLNKEKIKLWNIDPTLHTVLEMQRFDIKVILNYLNILLF